MQKPKKKTKRVVYTTTKNAFLDTIARRRGESLQLGFAARLRLLMREKEITARALGAQIGVSGNSIGAYIKDENPSIPRSAELYKLSKFFGKTMEWMLTGSPPEPPKQKQLSSTSTSKKK
ncbi:MAG: helix-turn-helix transcriptional regulator [Puniceicoccales bacterium]|jgi:hypothetical protein|nr:helix-turn-helix transcriptional regulator [Puniceicoccales bacterium]